MLHRPETHSGLQETRGELQQGAQEVPVWSPAPTHPCLCLPCFLGKWMGIFQNLVTSGPGKGLLLPSTEILNSFRPFGSQRPPVSCHPSSWTSTQVTNTLCQEKFSGFACALLFSWSKTTSWVLKRSVLPASYEIFKPNSGLKNTHSQTCFGANQ